MYNPVELVRYEPKEHSDILWQFYKNESCAEFFRRIPPTWRKEDITKFEELTNSNIFLCKLEGVNIGFAIISAICWYGLSAQVGLMLYEEFRDETRSGKKLAFWSILALARILFDKMTLKRMSMKFLKRRSDIEMSLVRGGFRKEGEYRNSVIFDGMMEDEFEYCLDKENYDIIYKI